MESGAKFTRSLKLEVYMFLMTISYNARSTPLDLLLQDKLCVNHYSISRYFCYDLYIPAITLWSLFLGHWTDAYPYGRRAVFVIGAGVQCMDALFSVFNSMFFDSDVRWVVLSYVPYVLSGSVLWSIAYASVAVTTPAAVRPVRMMSLEISVALGHLVSESLYGRLATDEPLWDENQIYSQAFIHLISGLIACLAFIWSAVAMDDRKDRVFYDHLMPTDEKDSASYLAKHWDVWAVIRQLISFNNVKQTLLTGFKWRPNSARAQIWLSIAGIVCYLYVFVSVPAFVDEFYQQIHGWYTTDFYDYPIETVALAAKCLLAMTATVWLINKYNFDGLSLAITGFAALIAKLVILATIVNPVGYYLSVCAGSVDWMANVGLRAHLSTLVPVAEVGKLYATLTAMEVTVPPIASSLSPFIFRETKDSFPGTCFALLVILCFVALLLTSVVLYLRRTGGDARQLSPRYEKPFNMA